MKLTIPILFLLVTPSTVWAEGDDVLRRAMATYVAAAAADDISTAVALSRCAPCYEGNPMYRWASARPATVASVAAATDVASIWAWQRFVGRRHPKIAKIGFYGFGAVRAWYAVQNIRIAQRH